MTYRKTILNGLLGKSNLKNIDKRVEVLKNLSLNELSKALTSLQIFVLFLLYYEKSFKNIAELGKLFNISTHSHMSKLMTELEKLDLIKKESLGRTKVLSLREKGEECVRLWRRMYLRIEV